MIYLAAGIVCLFIGGAYFLGTVKGYAIGYEHAIEDIESFSLALKKEIENRKQNEE